MKNAEVGSRAESVRSAPGGRDKRSGSGDDWESFQLRVPLRAGLSEALIGKSDLIRLNPTFAFYIFSEKEVFTTDEHQ